MSNNYEALQLNGSFFVLYGTKINILYFLYIADNKNI